MQNPEDRVGDSPELGWGLWGMHANVSHREWEAVAGGPAGTYIKGTVSGSGRHTGTLKKVLPGRT